MKYPALLITLLISLTACADAAVDAPEAPAVKQRAESTANVLTDEQLARTSPPLLMKPASNTRFQAQSVARDRGR